MGRLREDSKMNNMSPGPHSLSECTIELKKKTKQRRKDDWVLENREYSMAATNRTNEFPSAKLEHCSYNLFFCL